MTDHVLPPGAPAGDERWLPVVGYEGAYEVSDRGRVRSLDRLIGNRFPGTKRRWKGRIRKLGQSPSGHLIVTLRRDGASHTETVHRLVATAFLGPRPDGMECCHNNGDPADNRLSNLRWDTRSENCLDRVRHGVHASASKTRCKWGHLLRAPNLAPVHTRPGVRHCRACNQAHAAAAFRRRKGAPYDFEELATQKYLAIMRGADDVAA